MAQRSCAGGSFFQNLSCSLRMLQQLLPSVDIVLTTQTPLLPESNLSMSERQYLICIDRGTITQRACYRPMFVEATLVHIGGRYYGLR